MNVVVFALRGCPVSALGPYGNEAVGTPHLDRLAAEGIVFDRHISDCPDPAAARRAWRTGKSAILPHRGDPPTDLLPLLTSRGVRTVLIRHTREPHDPPAAFVAGWDELHTARPDPADRAPADALLRTLPGVLDRLADVPRWLVWVELDTLLPPWDIPQEVFDAYVEDLVEDADPPAAEVADDSEDAHDSDEETDGEEFEDEEVEDDEIEPEPAAPPEPILPWRNPPTGWFDAADLASWELLHRSFAAAVTSFDADLGRVFAVLRERGLDLSATWVFTADHGFPLGEHGVIGLHRPWLYEELVHVPLIVRLPNAAPQPELPGLPEFQAGEQAGRRIDALTQPADLMSTLAGWFGADVPAGLDGIPLQPLLDGRTDAVREFAVSGLELGPAAERAIRTPAWSYLLPVRPHPDDDPRPPLLFAKPDDRWEVNDERSRHPDTADELDAKLRAILSG